MADVADLPEPPQLYWSASANMLNPGLLLERELSGGCNGNCMQQRPQRLAHGPEQQERAERFGAYDWDSAAACGLHTDKGVSRRRVVDTMVCCCSSCGAAEHRFIFLQSSSGITPSVVPT
jgi:hypothetical protein